MVLTNLQHVPVSGGVGTPAKQPLTQDQVAQKMADSYHMSKEVADTYLETLKAYKEETGADFSSGPLRFTSIQLFGGLFAAQTDVDPVMLATYRATVNGKSVKVTPSVAPEPKTVSIVDHLQKELEEISIRDEAWVRKTYSYLKDTPEDQAFVAKTVDGYQHMAEFTKRLIAALTLTDDQPSKEKSSFLSDLLNVMA